MIIINSHKNVYNALSFTCFMVIRMGNNRTTVDLHAITKERAVG
jgi:hypothetical protein